MSGFSLPIIGPIAWTPTLTCVTPGNLSVAYTTRLGSYMKIGKLVVLSVAIQTSTWTYTTATGSIQITGLPFTNNATYPAIGAMNTSGWTRASYTWMQLLLQGGSSTLLLQVSGSAQGVGPDVVGSWPTGGVVVVQGTIVYNTD